MPLPFTDVFCDQWCSRKISYAYQHVLVGGFGNETFKEVRLLKRSKITKLFITFMATSKHKGIRQFMNNVIQYHKKHEKKPTWCTRTEQILNILNYEKIYQGKKNFAIKRQGNVIPTRAHSSHGSTTSLAQSSKQFKPSTSFIVGSLPVKCMACSKACQRNMRSPLTIVPPAFFARRRNSVILGV